MTTTKDSNCTVSITSPLIDTFIGAGGTLTIDVYDFTSTTSTQLTLDDVTGAVYTIEDLASGVYQFTLTLDVQSEKGCIFIGCELECDPVDAYLEDSRSINHILFDILDTIPQQCDGCECSNANEVYKRLINGDCDGC